MAVFTSREAAEEYAKGDPFVRDGRVTDWQVREWASILDRRVVRSDPPGRRPDLGEPDAPGSILILVLLIRAVAIREAAYAQDR